MKNKGVKIIKVCWE